jgi:hypothetical protein
LLKKALKFTEVGFRLIISALANGFILGLFRAEGGLAEFEASISPL